MVGEIVLICILLTPFLLGTIFRVHTSHIFFALMTGELLGRYFGHDLEDAVQPFLGDRIFVGSGEIFLILVPVLLTCIMLRKTIAGNRILLHSLPLLATGVIAASFLLPLLPLALQSQIRSVPFGGLLLDISKSIIGAMVLLQLVWVWLFERRGHADHKER